MNFLQDWLEGNPSAVFANWSNQLGGTPAQKTYYGNNYNNTYSKYMGALANTAQQGNIPTQTFGNWLQSYPWLKEFQNQPSYMRGYNPAQFSPRSRWMLY
jgi:hypothetical protein